MHAVFPCKKKSNTYIVDYGIACTRVYIGDTPFQALPSAG
jgi:hypothetical protein